MAITKQVHNASTGQIETVELSPEEETAFLASKQSGVQQMLLDEAKQLATPSLEKRIEALERALLAIMKKG